MATDLNATVIPPELLADGEALLASILHGKAAPLDPEIARRIDERAEKITEEIRRKHGILNIAVPSIRELRDACD